MKRLRPIFLTVVAGLMAPLVQSATITVVNTDGAGEGFNDPTVVAALPSNPFTTLGQQRLHVFQTAANQWGALLVSAIEIRVQAAFNPLACNQTSAVLGSAGAITIHNNFANAPVANVWYNSALASSLAGVDINGASNDINSQFNVDIDNGACLTGTTGWYYSTLASDSTPAGRIPLLPVVFHELAHGLGFQTFTSSSTGAFNGGTPSIWDTFLADAVTGTTWINMASNAVRQASAISDPNLIWKGPRVTLDKVSFLGPAPVLIVTAPAAIAGEKVAAPAAFGAAVPPAGISGEVLAASDTGGTSALDGCESLT
ncbi:MAG: peptidase, partial [Lysobacterales bacterium CG02_land_8_20_14_3_00_62_12]